MSTNRDKKLERIKHRLDRARQRGADVVIEHDNGEEVYHVQRDAEGKVAWTKKRNAATAKPGEAA